LSWDQKTEVFNSNEPGCKPNELLSLRLISCEAREATTSDARDAQPLALNQWN